MSEGNPLTTTRRRSSRIAEATTKRSNDEGASFEVSRPSKQTKRVVVNPDDEPLIFDQLIGPGIEYDKGWGDQYDPNSNDKSKVCSCSKGCSSALSNSIMRDGKHYATFERNGCSYNLVHVGIMRPVKGLDPNEDFSLLNDQFEELLKKTPERWGDGTIHVCMRELGSGKRNGLWSEGKGKVYNTNTNRYAPRPEWGHWEGSREHVTLGMLLDLDAGTLSVYSNGRNLGVLKDGLTGEYCWAMEITDIADGTAVHMKRGAVPTS